jgi:hypothetical protein
LVDLVARIMNILRERSCKLYTLEQSISHKEGPKVVTIHTQEFPAARASAGNIISRNEAARMSMMGNHNHLWGFVGEGCKRFLADLASI